MSVRMLRVTHRAILHRYYWNQCRTRDCQQRRNNRGFAGSTTFISASLTNEDSILSEYLPITNTNLKTNVCLTHNSIVCSYDWRETSLWIIVIFSNLLSFPDHIGRTRFTMQSYCGRIWTPRDAYALSGGPKPAAFHNFSFLKIGYSVFVLPLNPCLFNPFAAVWNACKTVFPTDKLHGALQKGKKLELKHFKTFWLWE